MGDAITITSSLAGLKVLPRANSSLLGYDNGCFPTTDRTRDSPSIVDRKNISLTFITDESEIGCLDSTTIELTLDSE